MERNDSKLTFEEDKPKESKLTYDNDLAKQAAGKAEHFWYDICRDTTNSNIDATLCVSYYKQYGLGTVIVRPCHTYGPSITEHDNRANAQFFRKALSGQDIILNSPGNQMRSYCYVADCVSAILTVLLNGESGEAYNIANPDARVTIAEFAHIVAKTAGRKVVYVNPDETELGDRTPITKQVLDTRKLESLGWVGQFNAQDGIANTIAIIQEIRL